MALSGLKHMQPVIPAGPCCRHLPLPLLSQLEASRFLSKTIGPCASESGLVLEVGLP